MRVDVYYNLHKKCLSIRHKGKVFAHSPTVELGLVEFIVSQAGRKRVLKEKRKNVHAVVRGTFISYGNEVTPPGKEVTYDPYKYSTFVYRNGETPIYSALRVYIKGKKIFAMTPADKKHKMPYYKGSIISL